MPRTRNAYEVWTNSHGFNIVYAPTASAARAKVISNVRDAWGCTFREALEEVGRARRHSAHDVILPDRHPLTPALGEKVLHCVVHAFGGTGSGAGSRDHFYTDADDWVMRAALYHCLFRVRRIDKRKYGLPGMIMYELTDLGKNVALGEQKTYPEHA